LIPSTSGSIFCSMNKDQLRKIYLAKRLALTENEHHELSNKICERFFGEIDLSTIKVLHIFFPIESKREPNTWLMINQLRNQYPHIQLVIPRVKDNALENIFLEDISQVVETKWGMLEPMNGTLAQPQELDLVLVPLLAFDKQGHRIGYGKGFYDRFLHACRPDCHKIGISLFEPEEVINEKLEADVMLNQCITPFKIYSF